MTQENIFKRGKLTYVLDGGAGSSAKSLRAAYMWKHFKKDHTRFCTNTFMSNAAHTITLNDDREIIHQCFGAPTILDDYDMQYLGPGCVFSLKELNDELNAIQLVIGKQPRFKIHPNVAIVTSKDIGYERGVCNFDGNKANTISSNMKIGSTLHGVGAARARRILRRDDALLARDVKELEPYIADTASEIYSNLIDGSSGLAEIAQGYQLSLYSQFYPKCTSRNCTVAASLDDSMLPPVVAGPVVINFRTFPIRVNNNKYINKHTNAILTWDEYNNADKNDVDVVVGDSGSHYYDQTELSWDDISKRCGEKIFECTSLTKLPRRVFTFSKANMMEAMIFNNTGDDMYLSVNFMNYVDANVKSMRTPNEVMTDKVIDWLKDNVFHGGFQKMCDINKIKFNGLFIGTYKRIDDSIFLSLSDLAKYNLIR